ncbi:MAG: sel1 repeat family protein [Nitrospina sp.]|nr:sel1 repeat family protein [Nitrospina sp.]
MRRGRGYTILRKSSQIVSSCKVDQGLINAQYNLGLMYAYGNGISQANKEVVKWFQLTMGQNNKLVQGELNMLPSKKSLRGKIEDIF